MYFEYETPVCSLVMMWSTPSSRNLHVVSKSAFAGGIGYDVFAGGGVGVDIVREYLDNERRRRKDEGEGNWMFGACNAVRVRVGNVLASTEFSHPPSPQLMTQLDRACLQVPLYFIYFVFAVPYAC